jgi:hypothetical protein
VGHLFFHISRRLYTHKHTHTHTQLFGIWALILTSRSLVCMLIKSSSSSLEYMLSLLWHGWFLVIISPSELIRSSYQFLITTNVHEKERGRSLSFYVRGGKLDLFPGRGLRVIIVLPLKVEKRLVVNEKPRLLRVCELKP